MPIVIVYTAGDFPPGAVQEAAAPFVAQKTYATSSDPADNPQVSPSVKRFPSTKTFVSTT